MLKMTQSGGVISLLKCVRVFQLILKEVLG